MHPNRIQSILQSKNFVLFLFSVSFLCLSYGCKQANKNLNKAKSEMLDAIEAQMFQQPEILDSLLAKIDTTVITPKDKARINSINGLICYDNGEYEKCISYLAKAETYFAYQKDTYHFNTNNLIKAFALESLNLDNNAANLYIKCKNYFEKYHFEKLKFYASLGLFRLSKQLFLNRNELIKDLKKNVNLINEPIYDGLFYASMANIEKNDSIKREYYEHSKTYFIKAHCWSRVYATELNTLFAKIRQDQSENIQKYYNNFPNKKYFYTPTIYQRMHYKYGQAYLFALQGKIKEAIEVANRIVEEAVALKLPTIESDCVKLLSVSYMQIGDYKNAYWMQARNIVLQEKNMEALQKNRLLALGAHYRYTEMEREKADLKLQIQKAKLIWTILILIIIIIIIIGLYRLKENRHKQEILKLKNITIEDQMSNLRYALEHEVNKNAQLITKLDELTIQYKNTPEINKLILEIKQNQIETFKEFEPRFMELHPGWIEKLHLEVPKLTKIDLNYCMLINLNLDNKLISKIWNVGIEAVISKKKQIRDKLFLEKVTEINEFLKKFD